MTTWSNLPSDTTWRLPRVAAPDEVVGETAGRHPAGRRDRRQHGSRAGAGSDRRRGRRGLAGNQRHGLHTSAHQTHDPTGTVAGFADATGAFLPLVCTLNAARNLAATAGLLSVSFDDFAAAGADRSARLRRAGVRPIPGGRAYAAVAAATGELVGLRLGNLHPRQRRSRLHRRECCGASRTASGAAGQLGRRDVDLPAHRADAPDRRRGQVSGGAAHRARGVRLPVTLTDVAESVAIGAARQAAWALTGRLPDLVGAAGGGLRAHPRQDVRAAAAVDERYRAVVGEHYLNVASPAG